MGLLLVLQVGNACPPVRVRLKAAIDHQGPNKTARSIVSGNARNFECDITTNVRCWAFVLTSPKLPVPVDHNLDHHSTSRSTFALFGLYAVPWITPSRWSGCALPRQLPRIVITLLEGGYPGCCPSYSIYAFQSGISPYMTDKRERDSYITPFSMLQVQRLRLDR